MLACVFAKCGKSESQDGDHWFVGYDELVGHQGRVEVCYVWVVVRLSSRMGR